MAEMITVSTTWFNEHLEDTSIVPLDVRPPYFYAQAHLPRAVNLPIHLLSSGGGAPPESAALASQLGRLGITRDSHILAYDGGASHAAARLYWVLQYYRHPRISLLDGGITKWRHDGLDWEYVSEPPVSRQYDIDAPDPGVLASIENIRDAIDDPQTIILDVRTPAEYLGLEASAARNGHVPGAMNIDVNNNLAENRDAIARLRSDDELRRLYEQAGVTPDRRVIVYCQSGIRSSETFVVLKKLGFRDVRNYVGGWQEWGNRHDTPVDER